MLEAAGSESADVLRLWRILCILFLWVFLVVITFVAAALAAKKLETFPKYAGKIFLVGLVFTTVVLFAVVATSFQTSSASVSAENQSAQIEVVGKLWWWEVNYLSPDGDILFTTANEIHLPLNKVTRIRLLAADVIHSFWVPELGGKVDMIPGHRNYIELEPHKLGNFTGLCAELCGKQHALMTISVVVEPTDAYQNWISDQSKPNTVP